MTGRQAAMFAIVTKIGEGIELEEKLRQERDEAEQKAFDALSRYKFQMFGYWAAIWVHLNRLIGDRRPNPFGLLVAVARNRAGR